MIPKANKSHPTSGSDQEREQDVSELAAVMQGIGVSTETQTTRQSTQLDESYLQSGESGPVLGVMTSKVAGTSLEDSNLQQVEEQASAAIGSQLPPYALQKITDFGSSVRVNSNYEVMMSQVTLQKVEAYLKRIQTNQRYAGQYLKKLLRQKSVQIADLTAVELIRCLLETKQPKIFAESAIKGNGEDWTPEELSILGDIGVATAVDIYDNGHHLKPVVHDTPLTGHLLFVPGALLTAPDGVKPADFDEVILDGKVNFAALKALYFRRLIPLLAHVNQKMIESHKKAIVTIPGIGTGCFAGKYKKGLKEMLGQIFAQMIEEHPKLFQHIEAVYYDPYERGEVAHQKINQTHLIVKPLQNLGVPQLCHPSQYQVEGTDFSQLELFSIVAWDHVSWPGNDFYVGLRQTDDGVKAAATNSMEKMTGVKGQYDKARKAYLLADRSKTWLKLIQEKELTFGQDVNIFVCHHDA